MHGPFPTCKSCGFPIDDGGFCKPRCPGGDAELSPCTCNQCTKDGGRMSNENIPVKRPGAKTVPLNAGISAVVVTEVIDQGVQPNRFNPERPRHQVLVRFTDADGRSAA